MNRFRRFMNGRYGYDQFGRFLFIVSLVFWALSGVMRFTPFRRLYFIFWALNTVLYVYAFFRFFSIRILPQGGGPCQYHAAGFREF